MKRFGNIITEEIEMRNLLEKSRGQKRLAIIVALFCMLVSIPALSSAAGTSVSNVEPMMTIAVTNNSSRDIYHFYLSPVDHDAWGPDLITEGTVVRPGQTFTINNVSCGGNEIKVIAEDQQGCFFYAIVGCAQASSGWTITNDTPPDCGN